MKDVENIVLHILSCVFLYSFARRFFCSYYKMFDIIVFTQIRSAPPCLADLPIYSVSMRVPFRVTRLGDFSPDKWLTALGNYFENYKNSPHFGATF
jgi:hypothetical protein